MPPPADERALYTLKRQIGDRPTWAAISTHDGEEAVAAEVHAMLHKRHHGLLTIVVPRHPDRAEALAAQNSRHGPESRSAQQAATGSSPIRTFCSATRSARWGFISG